MHNADKSRLDYYKKLEAARATKAQVAKDKEHEVRFVWDCLTKKGFPKVVLNYYGSNDSRNTYNCEIHPNHNHRNAVKVVFHVNNQEFILGDYNDFNCILNRLDC